MSDAVKMTSTQAANLRAPFPADQVGQLPKGGTTLDYVGHGAVRLRLLDVDTSWNWAPLALDERGLPIFDLDTAGNPIGLWIRLSVCGVTRLGYGSCPGKQFDAEKVLIGDAIRNAAMSFGVATYLWVKGHDEDPQDGPRDRAPRTTAAPDPTLDGWASRDAAKREHADTKALIAELSEENRAALKAWRDANGCAGWPLPRAQFNDLTGFVISMLPDTEPF